MSNTMHQVRAQLEARLRELEAERTTLINMLAAMQESTSRADQPKLAESIEKLLQEQSPLHLRDLFRMLKEIGYVFRGQNPKMSIYSALSRHPETFQKTDKGWKLTPK